MVTVDIKLGELTLRCFQDILSYFNNFNFTSYRINTYVTKLISKKAVVIIFLNKILTEREQNYMTKKYNKL